MKRQASHTKVIICGMLLCLVGVVKRLPSRTDFNAVTHYITLNNLVPMLYITLALTTPFALTMSRT
ncbi:hypothetical protein C8R48DRAFT_708833 [Suillus tomentosus]|nr:hypothetical protein C8R48DRAFT_708833 [Suillus tomentosus]